MFPQQLANDAIYTWSNKGELVFDPFLGSGTTAIEAIHLDRHYIGFEISDEYFDICCKRIEYAESEYKQISIFDLLKGE